MLANRMSRHGLSAVAARRTRAVASHMMSSSATIPGSMSSDPSAESVRFESHGILRKYILNRPKKYNALDSTMIDLLRPRVLEWSASNSCQIVVGTGEGPAFCAGGDVQGVVEAARSEETRPQAIDFFRKEFELDLYLARLTKPYVVFMDGFTMGGGVGLAQGAHFRIATEKTVWAMPETNIGYSPDVGASFFLHNLDGHLGTYLALTGQTIKGRAAYELGIATHYVPSHRIPALTERLAALEDASFDAINATIEEHVADLSPGDVRNHLVGPVRTAVDKVFRQNNITKMIKELNRATQALDESVRVWGKATLETLSQRSPTSLKVALKAIRKGQAMKLSEALQMELGIATAFCSGASPDFDTGVTAVLIEKNKGRPAWSPNQHEDVTDEEVEAKFFDAKSPYLAATPRLNMPDAVRDLETISPMKYALPSEEDIGMAVKGSHGTSGSHAITLEDLIARFEGMASSKIGVREKVVDVAKRRTRPQKDEEGNEWLVWQH